MTEFHPELLANAQIKSEEQVNIERREIQKHLVAKIISLMNENPNYKMLAHLE